MGNFGGSAVLRESDFAHEVVFNSVFFKEEVKPGTESETPLQRNCAIFPCLCQQVETTPIVKTGLSLKKMKTFELSSQQ